MSEEKYSSYKSSKKLNEQIEYLEHNKRIQFDNINVKEAKEVLLRYNYINVITPFKHHFAKLNSHREVIKIDNKHVYERNVDFNEYYNYFVKERKQYPIIIKNILDFEIQFKSILAYHILTTFDLSDSNRLLEFIDFLKLNSLRLPSSYNNRKDHMTRNFDKIKEDIFKYADIYCFFDRMSLGNILTVFICLPFMIQENIFKEFKKFEINLNSDKIPDFIQKVFCMVSIRNTVMHGNSLEILVRFYNPKTHDLRKVSDKKKYITLIKSLRLEKPRE